MRNTKYLFFLCLILLSACTTTQTTVEPEEQLVEPAKQAATLDLAGTRWTGMDYYISSLVPFEYVFHPDHVLEYSYMGDTFKNGTWSQTGDYVYMEMNDKYSERVGVITGTKIEGDGWNIKGLKWDWHAELKQDGQQTED